MNIADVIILSIIEGITEFLPISSTGHLILASNLLGINQDDNFTKSFQVVIQLGAILAVLALFWRKFLDYKLLSKLFVAFLPAGICGLFFYNFIKSLFHPHTVVYMLIIGGILFIILELFLKNKPSKVNSLESISYKKAFYIGCFQALAMIPGTSRSGSTIFGGLVLKLNRKIATEFSFLLALPTMFIASGYDIYKNIDSLNTQNFLYILLGLFVTFIFAIFAIKILLKFISNFSYIAFGVYRIIVGLLFYFIVF